MDFCNKIAVISGGLGDIGSAIAKIFGKNGIRVAISDLLSAGEAEMQLQELRNEGCANLFYQKVDVTSEEQVKNWLDAVDKQWGLPQIIIPNAGIVVSGGLTSRDFSSEQARLQLEVNFWGSYHVAVQGAKKLKGKGLPGRITFIGSWVAERPNSRISSYCISKAAVRMLSKSLALELSNADIMVNEIAPGIVSGGLSKKNQQENSELLKTHLNSIPVHSLITVEEIAQQVLWMSDFENKNMTGLTVTIDGGLSLTSKMTP
jgi:glucose 1-dehydrogenase